MKYVSASLLLATAVTSTGVLRAEEPQPERTEGGLGLSIDAHFSATGSGDLKSKSVPQGSLSSREASVSISGEIPLGASDKLGIGLSSDGIYFDHDFSALIPLDPNAGTYLLTHESPLPEELQSVSLDMLWTHRFSDKWTSLVAVSPGFSWAGSRCTSDSFALRGIAGFQYTSSPTLSYMFGIAYDTLSHDYKVMPAAGVTWTPSKEWSVSVGFPKTSVVYTVTPAFTAGLVLEGKGGTYRVDRDPWQRYNQTVLNDSKLEYTDVRLGLELGYRLTPRCSITGTVGSVVYREFEYHKSSVKMAKTKSDEAALYGSVGLAVSF